MAAVAEPVAPDRAAVAVGLTTALRRAGLPTSLDRAARLADALAEVPPVARGPLYWTCRVVLVSAHTQLPVFDAVFSAVFDGLLDPADTRGDPTAPPTIGAEARTRPTPPDSRPSAPPAAEPSPPGPRPAAAASPADDRDDANRADAAERDALLLLASADERLQTTSFAELQPGELEQVRHLVRRIVLSTPSRKSRRTRPSRHPGRRLSIRHTVRAAERTGGDSTRLIYAIRRPRPRRLVFLCDVSGSMEPYTRVYLSLLQGAVAAAGAEAFVFATRLTRVTRMLSAHNPDLALAGAVASTADWAGGTRLAHSIRRFIDDFGRRGLARGSVVVIVSDGWATDDPAHVAAQMERLRRLAHRIIWVNPRKAALDYRPLVGGMHAALPFCDAFVSGHSYAALGELAALIAADTRAPDTHAPEYRSLEHRSFEHRSFEHRSSNTEARGPHGT